MKNKNFGLNDMVKIGLLCVVVGVGSMCAMDLATVVEKPRLIDRQKAVQGFLYNNFSGISFKVNEFGNSKAENINKEMKDRFIDPKDRNLRILFDFASLMPDLQRKIAGQLLGETNYSAMHNFLTKPMSYQVPCCIFSHMIADKKALPYFVAGAFDHNDPNSLQIGTVFEAFQDVEALKNIVIVDKLLRLDLRTYFCNRKELKAFDKVVKLFPLIQTNNENLWVRYTYRDAYTFSNIVGRINESQCFGFVVLGIPCISAFIGQKLCTKILVPHLAEFNRRNMIKNEGIIAKLQEKGEQLLPGDLSKMVNPLQHSWLNYAKIIAPYTAIGPSLILTLTLFDSDTKSIKDVIIGLLKKCKNARIATVLAMAWGMLPFGVFQAIFYVLSYAALRWDSPVLEALCDNRLAVHGCILGAYVLGCLLYNVRCMRKIQNSGVQLKNISQKLNNKNIIINNEKM